MNERRLFILTIGFTFDLIKEFLNQISFSHQDYFIFLMADDHPNAEEVLKAIREYSDNLKENGRIIAYETFYLDFRDIRLATVQLFQFLKSKDDQENFVEFIFNLSGGLRQMSFSTYFCSNGFRKSKIFFASERYHYEFNQLPLLMNQKPLSDSQFEVLLFLHDYEWSAGVELALKLDRNRGNISRTLQKLLLNNYVEQNDQRKWRRSIKGAIQVYANNFS